MEAIENIINTTSGLLIDGTSITTDFVTARNFRGEKINGLGFETTLSNTLIFDTNPAIPSHPQRHIAVAVNAKKYIPVIPPKKGDDVIVEDGKVALKEHTRTGNLSVSSSIGDNFGIIVGLRSYHAYPGVDTENKRDGTTVADTFLGLNDKITKGFSRHELVKERQTLVVGVGGKVFEKKTGVNFETRVGGTGKKEARYELNFGRLCIGLENKDIKKFTDISVTDIQLKGEKANLSLNTRDLKNIKPNIVGRFPVIDSSGYN
jgi:hypothetical protein